MDRLALREQAAPRRPSSVNSKSRRPHAARAPPSTRAAAAQETVGARPAGLVPGPAADA